MSLNFGSESLFADFLEEVQALDDFRNQYSERHEFEGLGRDDQDVRRLMEAMAFYSARTRRAADRAILEYKQRTLERLFPYLLQPLPRMALLYPQLGPNAQESKSLPQGALVTQHAEERQKGAVPVLFRTVEASTIFPLHVVKHKTQLSRVRPQAEVQTLGAPKPDDYWLLKLQISPSAESEHSKRYYDDPERPLTSLQLRLNPGGDALLAVRVFDALQRAFRKLTCRFFSDGDERLALKRENISFGAVQSSEADNCNPIERARRAIHFPEAGLVLTVPLNGAPAQWESLELEFELNDSWPPTLAVGDSSFLLNSTVVENVERQSAEPIELLATESRYPITHPEPDSGMQLLRVIGVYLGDPAEPGRRETLFPSLLADRGYSVELENEGSSDGCWLELEGVWGKAEEPERLYVDAEWYQPSLGSEPVKDCRISIEAQDLGPMTWQFAEPQSLSATSTVVGDVHALDNLLELHAQETLGAAELRQLLKALGTDHSEVFSRIPRYITQVTAGWIPDPSAHQGAVRNYDVRLGKLPPLLLPAARLLFSQLPQVLATWTGDSDVNVNVQADAMSKVMEFTWRPEE